jgi:hypothetical protein
MWIVDGLVFGVCELVMLSSSCAVVAALVSLSIDAERGNEKLADSG